MGVWLVASAAGVEPWYRRVRSDFANAVAVDRSGDAVVSGLRLRGDTSMCDFFTAKLRHDTGAVVWRTVLPDCGSDEVYGPATGEQVLVDPAGDVVVAKRATWTFDVFKFSGGTGAVLWSRQVAEFPKHAPFVHASALDAAGDVIAAGGFGPYGTGRTDLVVVKLDGTQGTERWRRRFRGTFPGTYDCEAFNEAWSVAADAEGDVLASGMLVKRGYPRPHRHWTIMKLGGADGRTRWKRKVGETWGALAFDRVYRTLAVGPGGDVVSVATTARRGEPSRSYLTVVRLAGSTGRERWRRTLSARAFGPQMLATTGDGGVAVVGAVRRPHRAPALVLAVLDVASGRVRWRRTIHGSADDAPAQTERSEDAPAALIADAAGNVLLAGRLRNAGGGSDFAVIAFDAATGRERWRRTIDGGMHADEGARGLALAGGDVVAVGEVERPESEADALMLSLSASSGDEHWSLLCDGVEACGPADARAGDTDAVSAAPDPVGPGLADVRPTRRR